jgi:hypothetical protein
MTVFLILCLEKLECSKSVIFFSCMRELIMKTHTWYHPLLTLGARIKDVQETKLAKLILLWKYFFLFSLFWLHLSFLSLIIIKPLRVNTL